jgi:hypothetical protein
MDPAFVKIVGTGPRDTAKDGSLLNLGVVGSPAKSFCSELSYLLTRQLAQEGS